MIFKKFNYDALIFASDSVIYKRKKEFELFRILISSFSLFMMFFVLAQFFFDMPINLSINMTYYLSFIFFVVFLICMNSFIHDDLRVFDEITDDGYKKIDEWSNIKEIREGIDKLKSNGRDYINELEYKEFEKIFKKKSLSEAKSRLLNTKK